MRIARVLIEEGSQATAIAGRPLRDHWRWVCAAAGLDAHVEAPEARPTPPGLAILVDGRCAAIAPEALHALVAHAAAGVIVGPDGVVIAARLAEDIADRPLFEVLAQAEGPVRAVVTAAEAARLPAAALDVEAVVRRRHADRLRAAGARILDPATTWLDTTVQVAPGATVHPQVTLRGRTAVAAGAEIRPGCWLEDTDVGEGARVDPSCVCTGARIGPGCVVGPFAHLRPGAVLGRGVRVGNFVEVKATTLEDGAKASHLSYLGDAHVGAGANIGAGTITCNYDGFAKHRTAIGAGAFIGSNSALVAPLSIGERAIVGAGSVVTQDVPADALFVERAPPKLIERGASRLRRRKEEPS